MFDDITEVIWSGWTGEMFLDVEFMGDRYINDRHPFHRDLWEIIQSWEMDDSHYQDESYVIYRRPQ